MTKPLHHHFLPEELAVLEWGPMMSIDIKYEAPRDTRFDRLSPDKSACLNGYHEATFAIGADHVGYVLIPDDALELVHALREVKAGEAAAAWMRQLQP